VLLPHNVPITLLNVSHGGFLMRSPVAYAVDDMHKFRFTIPGEPSPIVLRGRVRHLTPATTNGIAAYAIGVQFMDSASRKLPASDSTPRRRGISPSMKPN
jgi:Tfp pilus assembly protein PilZ